MRNLIYTVITKGYDVLRNPVYKSPGYDYVCYTDDEALQSDFWEIRPLVAVHRGVQLSGVWAQRWRKIIQPEGYNITVYMDGNQQLVGDVRTWVNASYRGGIRLKTHHSRSCVYDEGAAIITLGKASANAVKAQLDRFRQLGLPRGSGMWETGIMIRNSAAEVKDFCMVWMDELLAGTHRDQLAIAGAVHILGHRVLDPMHRASFSAYFRQHPHASTKANPAGETAALVPAGCAPARIRYITPYDVGANIGRAYNEECARAGKDDWICLRDGDTMFLTPDWGRIIHAAVEQAEGNYDLLGCYTNRLAGHHQLVSRALFNESDMSAHHEEAKERAAKYGPEILNLAAGNGIAGMFMLFPRRVWERHPFPENNVHFDTVFSNSVRARGGKIGLIRGLYLFHMYRWGAVDPVNEWSHLKLK